MGKAEVGGGFWVYRAVEQVLEVSWYYARYWRSAVGPALEEMLDSPDWKGEEGIAQGPAVVHGSEIGSITYIAVASDALSEALGRVQTAVLPVASGKPRSSLAPTRPAAHVLASGRSNGEENLGSALVAAINAGGAICCDAHGATPYHSWRILVF